MMQMGRFIGCLYAVLIKNGAKHLSTFKDHLHHVLIRMVCRARSNIMIQDEDIHTTSLLLINARWGSSPLKIASCNIFLWIEYSIYVNIPVT